MSPGFLFSGRRERFIRKRSRKVAIQYESWLSFQFEAGTYKPGSRFRVAIQYESWLSFQYLSILRYWEDLDWVAIQYESWLSFQFT